MNKEKKQQKNRNMNYQFFAKYLSSDLIFRKKKKDLKMGK